MFEILALCSCACVTCLWCAVAALTCPKIVSVRSHCEESEICPFSPTLIKNCAAGMIPPHMYPQSYGPYPWLPIYLQNPTEDYNYPFLMCPGQWPLHNYSLSSVSSSQTNTQQSSEASSKGRTRNKKSHYVKSAASKRDAESQSVGCLTSARSNSEQFSMCSRRNCNLPCPILPPRSRRNRLKSILKPKSRKIQECRIVPSTHRTIPKMVKESDTETIANTSSTCSSSQSQTEPRVDRFKCLRKFCRLSRSNTSQTCGSSPGVISRHRGSTSDEKLEPGHPFVSTNYPASENDSCDQTDVEFCRDFTSQDPEQFCKTRTRDSKSKISGIRHFRKRPNCFARRTPAIPCNSYCGRS